MNQNLITLLTQCQKEAFSKEKDRLKNGKDLPKTSTLLGLRPYVDKNDILRVGGRTPKQEKKIKCEINHEIILPRNHELTDKIIRAFHEKFNHLGTNFILSHILQYYWPIRGRESVKRIGKSCIKCQVDKAKPRSQLMGTLPPARLAIFQPAFTNTSTDCFGPIYVNYGRGRTTKRYGVIFACLTTRAVYIDSAKSLSTHDFLIVFRRFQAVYGTPEIIYSDNGTNFVKREKELRTEVEQLNNQLPFDQQGCAALTNF